MNALWPRRDRLVLGGLQGIGFGLLAVSWLGVSGTTTFSRQLAWLNVGGAGLIAVVLGCALWVHRGRRQVGSRLGFTTLLRRTEPADSSVAALPDTFAIADGMTRYHRPYCQAVAGKTVITADVETHRADGRRPCGMCIS